MSEPIRPRSDGAACWTPEDDRIEEAEAEPAMSAPRLATNNATRTSERKLEDGAYAEAGYAPGGHAIYATAALAKGKNASGVEVEIASASAQVGAETEAQVTTFRVGYSNAHFSGTAEALTASAHAGVHNPDGSVGENDAVAATLLGAEATLKGRANAVTVGVGLSAGAEGSIGVRDVDKNGKPEICGRVGVKLFTLGACVEVPFHVKL